MAMADRGDMLDRLCLALSRPGVSGVLGTPDVIEDLLLLGALEGKAVFGSMNRGGLQGAAWEVDDRFTAYDAAAIEAMGLQGGKMLVRIDLEDPATAATVAACARAVSDLAARRLVAMVEPFMARRGDDGRLRTELTTEAAVRASVIAAGLGTTSAHTWLKVPVVDDMERVVAATTLPTVLLGGEVSDDQDATFERWRRALDVPGAIGLVVGRSLLYPPGDDVAAAVDTAVSLLPRAVTA
jgi:DhnA family fructose-bisphosphate aldolase class Ia